MKNKLILTAFLAVSLFSCSRTENKKTYYYQENNGILDTLHEVSDSAAYLHAFRRFEISKKVSKDIEEEVGQNYLEKPRLFYLYNEKMENITYQVFFMNKIALEDEIINKVKSLPNNIKR